jgi:hypothetical protein
MPIANRNLKEGTVLLARYKGKEHRAKVVKTKDGLRYRTADGAEFTSPSSAGAHVKGGGKTCDGWEFWSVEGAAPVPRRGQKAADGQAPKRAKAPAARKPARAAKPKPVTKAKGGKKSRKVAGGSNGKRAQLAKLLDEAAEKPIACGDCGEQFPTGREVAAHMREQHGSVEAPGIGTK